MKTQYYYIGQMARICSKAATNKANPFPLKTIKAKVFTEPEECVKLCERFRSELQDSQLEAFEEAHINYKLVSLVLPYDKYQISSSEQKLEFQNGYQFRMPRGYLLANILLWLIGIFGVFLILQCKCHFYRNQFSSAIQEGNIPLAKTLLTISLNPKETISGIQKHDCGITDFDLLKRIFKLGYKPSPKQIIDWYKTPEYLQLFLQNGGDINVMDVDTPVLFKAQDVKLLDLILKEGKPDFTIRCNDGTSIAFHAKSAEILNWLADHDVDMECKDENGRGLFESFLLKQDTELMQFFVDRKYDFNQKLSDGMNCIFCLIDPKQDFSLEFIDFMIQHGTKVNAANATGKTPLMLADTFEKFKLLIDHGANVNAKNAQGQTPAMLVDTPEKLALLIEHGADVNAKDNQGKTPIMWVNTPEQLELLIEHGADVNAKDNQGYTPLWQANSLEKFKTLVEHGADVNAKDPSGNIPIMKAETFETFKLLVEHGADIQVKDSEGNSLLHLVDTPEKKKLLLEKGADFMAENDEGLTPLEYQIQGYIKDLAEANSIERTLSDRITSFNIKVDAYNKTPPTPRPFYQKPMDETTAFFNDPNVVLRRALSKERDEIESDSQKLSVLKQGLKYVDIIDFYIDQNCDVAAIFQRMLARRQEAFIPIFCASKLDLQNLGYEGKTFLEGLIGKMEDEVAKLRKQTESQIMMNPIEHMKDKIRIESIGKRDIIEMYYVRIMAELVEKGADINQKNSEGSAIIHITTRHYLPRITRAVLKLGAETNIKDADGNTPLHYAAFNKLTQYQRNEMGIVTNKEVICDIETMQSLIDKGAAIDTQNLDGKTPLHLAAENNCIESMELLLKQAGNLKDGKKSLEIEDAEGFSPMYYVSSLKAFDLLCEAGFDYQKSFPDGMNMLRNAVIGDDLPFFKELQKKGLIITTSISGENLMFYVQSPEMLQFLKDQGVEVNVKNDNGESPLQSAATLFIRAINNSTDPTTIRKNAFQTCELLYKQGCNSEKDKNLLRIISMISKRKLQIEDEIFDDEDDKSEEEDTELVEVVPPPDEEEESDEVNVESDENDMEAEPDQKDPKPDESDPKADKAEEDLNEEDLEDIEKDA